MITEAIRCTVTDVLSFIWIFGVIAGLVTFEKYTIVKTVNGFYGKKLADFGKCAIRFIVGFLEYSYGSLFGFPC